jgi:hypothetical protein
VQAGSLRSTTARTDRAELEYFAQFPTAMSGKAQVRPGVFTVEVNACRWHAEHTESSQHSMRKKAMRDLSLVSRKAYGTKPMSRSQITALKDKIDTAGGAPTRLVRSAHSLLNWIRFCFVARPATNNAACASSGHVLPINGWVPGKAPNCGACGEKVVDPLELRSKSEAQPEAQSDCEINEDCDQPPKNE